LNIRISKNARPDAERAKEMLGTLGITVLGVVVNRVTPSSGASSYSYGYKGYHYRDGYGYANGYRSDNGGHDPGYPALASQGAPDAIGNQENKGEEDTPRGQLVASGGQASLPRDAKWRSNRRRASFLRRFL